MSIHTFTHSMPYTGTRVQAHTPFGKVAKTFGLRVTCIEYSRQVRTHTLNTGHSQAKCHTHVWVLTCQSSKMKPCRGPRGRIMDG